MSLSFTDFALEVYPFLELQPFHRVYYRVLEAFAPTLAAWKVRY